MNNLAIDEFGFNIGNMKKGKNNCITDVKGVTVGHYTIKEEDINTGITAILPHEGNIFKEKVQAASYVINGFGKTTGLIQLDELGTIETPIVLTNTLSVGSAFQGVIKYMLEENEDIGFSTGTVNPIICECNDGYLNNIRKNVITEELVYKTIKSTDKEFLQGAVGAGTGMCCLGLKGGIGSSSRIININNVEYTLGVLVLSNFGIGENLTIQGKPFGDTLKNSYPREDKGSIIVIFATDLPLNNRQLKRVCKRANIGLVRTGSYLGNGSGDIVIGFSTENKVKHYEKDHILQGKYLNENYIDTVFKAMGEATEESILNALINAETTVGFLKRKKLGLRDIL